MTSNSQTTSATSTIDNNLINSIRAALAGDPRSSTLSPKDFEALVHVLATKAQEQGMKASQIVSQGNHLQTSAVFQGGGDGTEELAPYMPAAVAILVVGLFLMVTLCIYVVSKILRKKPVNPISEAGL